MKFNLIQKVANLNSKNNVDIDDNDIIWMLEEIKEDKTITDFDSLEAQFLKVADEYLKDLFNDYFYRKWQTKIVVSDYKQFKDSLKKINEDINLKNKEAKTFYLEQLLKWDNNSLEAIAKIIAFRNNISKTIKNFVKSVLDDYVDKKGLNEQILKYTRVWKIILFREEDFFQDIIYQDYYQYAKVVSNIESFIKYWKYNYFDEYAENKFVFENNLFAQQMLLNYNKKFESFVKKDDIPKIQFASKWWKSIIIWEKEQEILYSFRNPKQKEYNKKQLLNTLENNPNPERQFEKLYDFYNTIRQVDGILEKFERQFDNYLKFIFWQKATNVAMLEQYTKLKDIILKAPTNTFNKETNTVRIWNDGSIKTNKEMIGRKIYNQIEILNLWSKLHINMEEKIANVYANFEWEFMQDFKTKSLNPKFEEFIKKDLRNVNTLEKVKKILLWDNKHKLFVSNINVPRKKENEIEILQHFKGKNYIKFDLDIL